MEKEFITIFVVILIVIFAIIIIGCIRPLYLTPLKNIKNLPSFQKIQNEYKRLIEDSKADYENFKRQKKDFP